MGNGSDDNLDARVSFRTSSDTVTALSKAATEKGVVTRRGSPNLSRMINSILERWKRAQGKK
jgi:hypothetical protein